LLSLKETIGGLLFEVFILKTLYKYSITNYYHLMNDVALAAKKNISPSLSDIQ